MVHTQGSVLRIAHLIFPPRDSRRHRGHLFHVVSDLQPRSPEQAAQARESIVQSLHPCRDPYGPRDLQVFYNSSKAAVSSMSKALAAEWAPYVPPSIRYLYKILIWVHRYSIRVNIVSPGYVKTEQSGVHPEAVRKFHCDSVPLGRVRLRGRQYIHHFLNH
jgi:NAD(P)-dependent dehydrogenase (short-subunit alcohol dehydrogenase family)